MDDKPSDYYARSRSELLPLLEPVAGKSFLDVGCGSGALGSLLKASGASRIEGIEIDPDEAKLAAVHYDQVLVQPLEAVDFSLLKNKFDAVICADVLEHLIDPWRALALLRGTMKPGGSLVASLPNARYRRVAGGLLGGKFEYVSSGILDRTHLRFFTFDSVVALFNSTGYRIVSIGPVYNVDADTMLPQWRENGAREKLQEAAAILTGTAPEFSDEDMLDFFTHQFILKAVKKE
jgi:O-antigen biosynthesis protein